MRKIMKTLYFLLAMVMLLSSLPMIASATTSQTEVVGKYYEFDKDSHYEFHEANTSETTRTEHFISTVILPQMATSPVFRATR